jgi:hypothetical protein
MSILADIPHSLDCAQLLRQAHIEPDSDDAAAFMALYETARTCARPKAFYKKCDVGSKTGDTVAIGDVTFTSVMLARNLATVARVFPFVCTCGCELDQVSLPPGDFLQQFWWDLIKQAYLNVARTYLHDHLIQRYRLGKVASMAPGTGDATVWPIEQQRLLFDLLDGVTAHIGVVLTDSFLMVPNKSVSGIFFPTEHDFRACQVCHRERCPGRSAPFDQALWDATQQSNHP